MLGKYPRVKLLGAPTPIEFLARFSDKMGREVYIKRDDLTPIGLGGNKLRKLEFLLADALKQGADVLLTAGAIQSNHVRQTAAVAAKFGLKCMALLDNPIETEEMAYLQGGNRQLSQLFGAELVMVANLEDVDAQLAKHSEYLQAQGFRPYTILPGGSSIIGTLGYMDCASEIAQQQADMVTGFSSVVVASGSGGTQAGLALGLEHWLPTVELIGISVSRPAADQRDKVGRLREQLSQMLGLRPSAELKVWDQYYAPGYGYPNLNGSAAITCLAEMEGLILDPVYTGKAMAGLIAGICEQRFDGDGAILFIHTGGAPALFSYPSLR